MQILYDEEFDILDVIFNEKEHEHTHAGYELRHGVVVFVTRSLSLVQLTAVNFSRLTELPVVRFDLLKKQSARTRSNFYGLSLPHHSPRFCASIRPPSMVTSPTPRFWKPAPKPHNFMKGDE